MKNKKFCFIVLILGGLLLNNCGGPDDCPCVKMFTIRGVVLDEAGNPIPDVDVVDVGHYGTTFAVKKTKSDGTYSFSGGRYASLGNEHVVFRKEGYQESVLNPIPLGAGMDATIKLLSGMRL